MSIGKHGIVLNEKIFVILSSIPNIFFYTWHWVLKIVFISCRLSNFLASLETSAIIMPAGADFDKHFLSGAATYVKGI